jgi:hypothetical protein
VDAGGRAFGVREPVNLFWGEFQHDGAVENRERRCRYLDDALPKAER